VQAAAEFLFIMASFVVFWDHFSKESWLSAAVSMYYLAFPCWCFQAVQWCWKIFRSTVVTALKAKFAGRGDEAERTALIPSGT
jgi:hypothetical protein